MQYSEKPTDDMPLNTMDTLSEVLNHLKKEGYTIDFNLDKNCISCVHNEEEKHLYPDDFEVEQTYRFEGESNPSDSSILYKIHSAKHNLKGTLINAYGVYADEMSHELAKKFN